MSDDLMPGKEFDGPWGKLVSSPWLSSLDLPRDKDTIVRIEKYLTRAEVEFVQTGGRKSKKTDYGSIKFYGATKELGLGATLVKTLATLFGSPAKSKGQWIALYVDPTVKVGGVAVGGVRIRAQHVEPPKTAAPSQPAAPAGTTAPSQPRQPGDDKPE